MNNQVSAIWVQNAKKYFRDVKAVDGVDIDIRQGEYVALLGPNGAGKTTMVEMIEGIQHPDEGNIAIMGKTWRNNANELRRLIGLSLQETHFIEKLSVRETLTLFAGFYSLGKKRVSEIMEIVKLTEKQKAYVGKLSGGQRQRLALGIALLNTPQVLLLDEPTTGLDPTARRELWDVLTTLKQTNNATLLLTTHYMEEATYLCDRIIIMYKGKVLAQGTLDQLLAAHGSREVITFSFKETQSQFELPNTSQDTHLVFDNKTQKWLLTVNDIVDYLPLFLENIKQQQLTLQSIECRKTTLDDLFIEMTGKRLDE